MRPFALIPPALLLAAAAPHAAMPRGFQGRWAERRADCAPGRIHGAFVITAKTLSDGEIDADVLSVQQHSSRDVTVATLLDMDGGYRQVWRYRLSADGRSLFRRDASATRRRTTETRLIRCGA